LLLVGGVAKRSPPGRLRQWRADDIDATVVINMSELSSVVDTGDERKEQQAAYVARVRWVFGRGPIADAAQNVNRAPRTKTTRPHFHSCCRPVRRSGDTSEAELFRKADLRNAFAKLLLRGVDSSVYIAKHPQMLRDCRYRFRDIMNKSRNGRKLAAAIALALVTTAIAVAGPAEAASIVVTANSTIPSGTAKTLGAAWGSEGPYKVSFTCGVPGCANFTSASTTATSVFRYNVAVATCSGVTYDTHTTIWEDAGAGASASGTTVTTWTKGKAC
jgi:hypothetical protein